MFSQTLKEIRKKKGLSQRALAETTGFCRDTIARYERGIIKPGYDFLSALVHKVNVKPQELF